MRTRSGGASRISLRKESRLAELEVVQTAGEERRKSPALQPDPRLKTPKLKSPKGKSTVQTPSRDDVLCSQHFDSQVVVGWDCNSPDTLRGIKRISGAEQHGDVSDLVMRLIGEDGDDEILTTKRSTPPLLGVWKEEQEDKLLDDNPAPHNRLRARKTRQRKRSGKDSSVTRDLLNKLSLALDKCNEVDDVVEEKETVPRTAEVTNVHNISDDLFSSESNNNETKITRTSPRLQEKKIQHKENSDEKEVREVEKSSIATVEVGEYGKTYESNDDGDYKFEDDKWSDDELFEEDSFIVKATQMPCDTKKFVSPVFGVKRKTSCDSSSLPKSKCTRYTFQLEDDKAKDKDSSGEIFTNIQNKPVVQNKLALKNRDSPNLGNVNISKFATSSTSSSRSNSITATGNSNLRSKTTTVSGSSDSLRSSTVTSSSKPPINQSTSAASSNSCYNFYSKTSQVYNNCAKNGATLTGSVPVTRQRTNLQTSNHINVNSTTNKPVASQCSSTLSNSFRKHGSFSGSDSRNGITDSSLSRRRSISGDNLPNNNRCVASTHNSLRNNSSCSVLRNTAASIYPAATASRNSSVTSNIASTVASSSSQSLPGMKTVVLNTSVIKESNKNFVEHTENDDTKFHHRLSSGRQSYCANTAKEKNVPPKLNDDNEREKNTTDRNKSAGLDTSLPDDILCQLGELDDLLDSTTELNDSMMKSEPVVNKTNLTLNTTNAVQLKTASVGNSVNVLPNSRVNTNHSQTIISNKVAVDSKIKNSVQSVTVPSNTNFVSKNSDVCNRKDIGLNSVNDKQPVKQYKFKHSQRKAASPREIKANVALVKTTTEAVCNSAKPTGQKVEQYSEDLFASDDDDDMMLADDDILTEPQILAMLDEVELMATQQQANEKSTKVSSHQGQAVDCHRPVDMLGNLDELSNSQGQISGSGDLTGSQGQPSGSQGHSNSQKYSPKEIERKKQEALERRKRKLNKM